MKKLVIIFLSLFPLTNMAQEVLHNGILKAKIETSTENNGGNEGSGMEVMIAGNETDIIVFLKDSLRKVLIQSNAMNSTNLYNGKTGITTVLTETMGEKTGYTQTQEQKLLQKRRADSIIKARENGEPPAAGGGIVFRTTLGAAKTTGIEYTSETKEINGMNCKKAIVTTSTPDGNEKKIDVWYTPDYILPVGVAVGRGGLDLSTLKGIPVAYEQTNSIKMGDNEMTMISRYELKKIDKKAAVADKEFDIPKGYNIKTWDEYLKDNPDGMPTIRRTFRVSQ